MCYVYPDNLRQTCGTLNYPITNMKFQPIGKITSKNCLISCRLVHLDVEDCSEELLRQQSYAIKNQLGHPKPPPRWFFMA